MKIFRILSIKLVMALVFTGHNSSEIFSQKFQNLDFQETCENTKTGLCFWDLSWGGENSCKADSTAGSISIQFVGEKENSVVFAEQSVSFGGNSGLHIIDLSVRLKTQQVIGKGAGLNIGMYDSEGSLISTKDMGGYYSVSWVSGTTDLKKITLSAVIPDETDQIKIGMILYGKGEVWWDDYEVLISPLQNRVPSQMARDYVQAAMDSILLHSLVRDSIEKELLLQEALMIAGPAQSFTECHLAINYMIDYLRNFGDTHSFFQTSEEVKNWEGQEGGEDEKIEMPHYSLENECGYMNIPGFHSGNKDLILAFADSIQNAIRILSDKKLKGWIVDLRENTGGNMEPMILGLGPLFSEEELGSLVDVNGDAETWKYKNGTYAWEDESLSSLPDPVKLKDQLPIAVLTSQRTGSSGEIVVISFIGNAHTKSFGQATWGLITGNGSFDLPDGSRLMLASTIMADRNDVLYYGPIEPDFFIEVNSNDDEIRLAIKWILEQ